ncbi:hypothetical protein [Fusobacterium sp.]|nr:hypothetical protein [Fusobacterium sp.]
MISENGTTTDLLLKNNIKVISENSDKVKNFNIRVYCIIKIL